MQYFREANLGNSWHMYYMQHMAYWHQMVASNPGLQPTLMTPLEYTNLVLQYSYIQRQLQDQLQNQPVNHHHPMVVHSFNQSVNHHPMYQPKTEDHRSTSDDSCSSASPQQSKRSRFDFSRLAESATSDLTPNVEERRRQRGRKEQEASAEACTAVRNNSPNIDVKSRLTTDFESDETARGVDITSQLQQKQQILLDLGLPCSLIPNGPQLLTDNNTDP